MTNTSTTPLFRSIRFSCKSLLRQLAAPLLLLAPLSAAQAQLTECLQIDINNNVNAIGGCINRTLLDQIGTGQGDVSTPGSSVYLIKRDPARSIRRGRQLFQRKFTQNQGQGPRVNFDSTGDITQTRALGAGLADSCAACHGRPRGSAGHGGDVVTRPDSRDAPHLFGLGLVEQLADEMTAELRSIRVEAISQATGNSVEQKLVATFPAIEGNFVILSPTATDGGNVIASVAEIRLLGAGGQALNIAVKNTYSYSESDSGAGALATDGDPNTFWASEPNDGPLHSPEVALYIELTQTASIAGIEYTPRQDGSSDGTITEFVVDIAANPVLSSDWTRASANQFEPTTLSDTSANGPVTKNLAANGIAFGSITANVDGSVDTSDVQGVDSDLRVKPFFAQGGTISMREFIIGALNDEMGLQAWDPVLCAATDPDTPQTSQSPAGFDFNPAVDTFQRPPVCDSTDDGDVDGVPGEIDPALVDHLEFYLLNYFKPGQYQVTATAIQGRAQMATLGCTTCHVPDMAIKSDRRVADVETVFDPANGIFNDMFANATTQFTQVDDGDAYPQLVPTGSEFVVKNFFSDLKRHDLGSAFHERDYDGTLVTKFVTDPLWGVGSTSPYGHDGRSINLDAVIRRHGGEAESAKQAYIALSTGEQKEILEFLQSLVLFPPDDTASNLNPGNPDTVNPQDPAEHGSINLGALFQIPSEGDE